MPKPNYEQIEKEIEKKGSRRQKKKKPVMKVVGAGVKNLQKILIAKKS
jgi:hypothetical protein